MCRAIGAGAVALLILAGCNVQDTNQSNGIEAPTSSTATGNDQNSLETRIALDDETVRPCAFDNEISGTRNQCGDIDTALSTSKPLGTISAPQLSVEYIRNQVLANDTFFAKKIILVGETTKISELDDVITVDYAAPYEMQVKAALWHNQIWDGKIVNDRELADHLSYGQYLSLVCDVRGVEFGEIKLANCVAVFKAKKPAPKRLPVPSSQEGDLSPQNVAETAQTIQPVTPSDDNSQDDVTHRRARALGWCDGGMDSTGETKWVRC